MSCSEEPHRIWTKGHCTWEFDGNLYTPTFNPSIRVTGLKRKVIDGKWTGDYILDDDGTPSDKCCHYFFHNGILKYCGDCLHDLKGQSVILPNFPDWYT